MINEKKNNHIEWLNGIKGISALGVFFHHFLLAFLPAAFFGLNATSHFSFKDTEFAQSPISVILNGNFFVCIFCLITGVIMSYKIITLKEKEKISSIIVKRYLRFILPILLVSFFVFIIMKLNLFYNYEASKYTNSSWFSSYYINNSNINLIDVFTTSIIKILFVGDYTFSNAFWMISILFKGSFISILLGQVYWKYKEKSLIVYFIVSAIFIYIDSYYSLFSLGAIIAILIIKKSENKSIINNIIYFLLLLIGLFLGGYPSGVEPTNIYSYINLPNFLTEYKVCHIIGSFLVVISILNLKLLQRILESKIPLFLNNISWPLYLIHIPILFSIGAKIFILLYDYNFKYILDVVITFILLSLILLISTIIYKKYIEPIIEKIISLV